jgi:Rad3-related DNA helicase
MPSTRAPLLAEAGTGTGKTFAYLVPALLSGLKTIVSTGTRALQDQLYLRDLPRVRDALGIGVTTALLKGRANYLCKHRLERAKGEPRFANREQIAQFQRIVAWSGPHAHWRHGRTRALARGLAAAADGHQHRGELASAASARSGPSASWCRRVRVPRSRTSWWSTITSCSPTWR